MSTRVCSRSTVSIQRKLRASSPVRRRHLRVTAGIPIPQWLCDELAAMVALRHKDESDSESYRTEPLFQTRYRNPLNRDKLRQDVIRPALRAAGLPETFRTYDLRHSHASVMIDLGVICSPWRSEWDIATPP